MCEKILLIDGHSILNRAFYAHVRRFRRPCAHLPPRTLRGV